MKTFMIALVFCAATVFPILFFPLLAITLLVILAVSPNVMNHGLDMWNNNDQPDKSLQH
jgi:hypothetical protein